MPSHDPKELYSPVKYKPRHVPRQLSKAEIKAAADRAETRSIRATRGSSPLGSANYCGRRPKS
jgi:hypothetical protein